MLKNFWDRIKSRPKFDWIFLALVVILSLIGVIAMGSASYATALYKYGNSYYFIEKQAIFLVVGLIGMIAISYVDYRVLKEKVFKRAPIDFTWGHLLYVVSVVLLVCVLIFGMEDENGIKRALNLGVSVQPSEIFKFALIFALSFHFYMHYEDLGNILNGLIIPVLYLAPVALIWIQPHASCTIICVLVTLCMMTVAGCMSLRNVLTGAASAAFVALCFGKKIVDKVGHLRTRIELWVLELPTVTEEVKIPDNVKADLYQTRQAKFAIGSGGLFGRGIGMSRQKMLFLPEPQNDFVFAIFCEETGFFGAVLVIMLFVALIYRGMKIAVKAKDRFGAMLAFGVTILIALQMMLNVAVVTGVIPNTGISLPFFSYGGSALVMFLLEMGVVLSVSRYSRIEKV